MSTKVGFQELVLRAKQGDQQAFDELLSALKPYMEEVARGYADPAHGAESTADLVQEAWVRTWQKLHMFEGGRSDDETRAMLHGWVGQMIHHLGLNIRRDQQTQKRRPEGGAIVSLAPGSGAGSGSAGPIPLADSGPTPSAVVAQSEESIRIQNVLDGLKDPIDKSLLHLRFFEDLPLTEVAKRLNLTYDRAVYRYRNLVERLERELGDLL